MKKALIIDNKIVEKFNEIPKRFKEYFRNEPRVDLLSEKERIDRGIKIVDIVIPEGFDPDLHKLTRERYVKSSNIVTYSITDRDDLPTIETLREQKKAELNAFVENEMYQALMFKALRILIKKSPDIPQKLKDRLIQIEAKEAEKITLIDQKADAGDIAGLVKFSFDRSEIEESKEILKSFRK